MKHYQFLSFVFVTLMLIQGCKPVSKTASPGETIKISSTYNGKILELNTLTGKGHNHPTFAVWLEDMNGEFIKTLFITRSYATGIYGVAALTDTTWINKPGPSYRPASLPYWTYKKGEIAPGILVPDKDNPYVDGYSGATPKGDFKIETKLPESGMYRVLMEVNQTWDWNRFWTNSKFPDNLKYRSSAQPSLIYAVTIDLNNPMDIYIMNPIGHGHYAGEDGRLYTDLSTFTTALEIFERIEITLK